MTSTKKFIKHYMTVITTFQLIELNLKRYISFCFFIIKNENKSIIKFSFDEKDVERNNLTELIEKFSKFSHNSNLVKKIKAIVKDRNYISHEALLFHQNFNSAYKIGPNYMVNILRIKAEALDCLDQVLEEVQDIELLAQDYTKP